MASCRFIIWLRAGLIKGFARVCVKDIHHSNTMAQDFSLYIDYNIEYPVWALMGLLWGSYWALIGPLWVGFGALMRPLWGSCGALRGGFKGPSGVIYINI